MTGAMALSKLTPAQILGLTGAGEARAELIEGVGWRPAPIANMIAVMWTPIHRVAADQKRFGADVMDACFESKQYSCWNPGTNRDWLLDQVARLLGDGRRIDGEVLACISEAARMLSGISEPDTVNGATHYFAPLSMIPPGRIPVWARGVTPCAEVGQHLFLKDV